MIEVELPDGTVVEFPDGTSADDMRAALSRLSGGTPAEKVIATTPDGGRVIERADGTRHFTSPGMATSDPKSVERILQGAKLSEVSRGAGPVSDGGRVVSGARSLLQGLAFKGGDELVAKGASALKGADYGTELALERRRLEQGEEKYPWQSLGSEVTGAIGTGVVTGGGLLSGAKTLWQRVLAGAAAGGVEGAAYEFGGGEGLDDRIDKAKTGLAVGAGTGALAPLVVSGGRAAAQRLSAPIGGLLNVGNKSRAQNAVLRAFNESGATSDEIEKYLAMAMSESQPDAVIADALGASGQRALSGVARQPGPARKAVTEFLDARQGDQADRIAGFLKDALDGGDTATVKAAEIATQRADDARLAYGAARDSAKAVNLSGVIDDIDGLLRRDPILGESSLSQGALGRRLKSFSDRISRGGEQLIDFDTTLQIRTDLREYLEQNPRARATFSQVYDGLTEALRKSSPEFQAANDGYRAASKVLDAVDAGKAANRPGNRADDVTAAYRAMTPEQQAAFRVGYADSLLAKIESARPGQNMADPLRSTRQQAVLGEIADDPARLMRQIGREQDMFSTRHIATQGSQTSSNLADQMAVNGDDVSILGNLFAGRPVAAGGQAAGRILSAATGMNEGTRGEIAEMLLGRDPQGLLSVIAADSQRQALQNVFDAGVRGGSRGASAPDAAAGLLRSLGR
jgi:DNA-binding phage protein